MAKKHDWASFASHLADEASRRIRADGLEPTDEVNEAFKNHLLGLEGPTTISRPLSRDSQYFGKVFYGFLEIETCKERLEDIEIYIGSSPYRNKRLSKIRLLRYHIEGYFHEIYILRERLQAYFKVLGRRFRKDTRHQSILAVTRPLFTVSRNVLEGITNTRSQHVHVSRFEAKDLSRLNTLEFVTTAESMLPELNGFYQFSYRDIRREWKAKLKGNNKAVTVLLDQIAMLLTPTLFDSKTGKLRYPRPKNA